MFVRPAPYMGRLSKSAFGRFRFYLRSNYRPRGDKWSRSSTLRYAQAVNRTDIDEAVIGATAPTGRVGEVIRRGGRGRYWEIILADAANEPVSRYVDGLDRAFDAVPAWLQGESLANALIRIENAIVAKPGERGW